MIYILAASNIAETVLLDALQEIMGNEKYSANSAAYYFYWNEPHCQQISAASRPKI